MLDDCSIQSINRTPIRVADEFAFRLLDTIASQSDLGHERSKAWTATNFFFQNIRRMVLQIAQNDRRLPVFFQRLGWFTKFTRAVHL